MVPHQRWSNISTSSTIETPHTGNTEQTESSQTGFSFIRVVHTMLSAYITTDVLERLIFLTPLPTTAELSIPTASTLSRKSTPFSTRIVSSLLVKTWNTLTFNMLQMEGSSSPIYKIKVYPKVDKETTTNTSPSSISIESLVVTGTSADP